MKLEELQLTKTKGGGHVLSFNGRECGNDLCNTCPVHRANLSYEQIKEALRAFQKHSLCAIRFILLQQRNFLTVLSK